MSIAEDVINGVFCSECLSYIGESVGFPRVCYECAPPKTKKKVYRRKYDPRYAEGRNKN